MKQPLGRSLGRDEIYTPLTDRPDHRRPLTWERHPIDLLIIGGDGRSFGVRTLDDASYCDAGGQKVVWPCGEQ